MLLDIMKPFPMSQASYVMILCSAPLAVLAGIVLTLYFYIKAKKHKRSISDKLKYNTISMLFICISAIYAALNFGWLRYSLALFMMVQSILLVMGSNIASQYVNKSVLVKSLVMINYILFICAHLILPDTLANNLSGFFGLVAYSEAWGNAVFGIAQTLFIVNVLFLIAEIVISLSLRLKKH